MGFYTSVGMTAQYTLPKSFPSQDLQKTIYSALRKVLDRHPAMGATIAGTPRDPSWVRLQEIDLSKVIQFIDGKDVRQVIEDTHQLRFDGLGELPLWRMVVISQGKGEVNGEILVGFFFHHAIGDGGSGFAFHMDLLDAFNTPTAGAIDNTETSYIVKVPKLDMLPPLEGAHELPLGWFFITSQVLKSILLPAFPDPSFWSGPPIRSDKNITHIRTFSLPSETLDPVLQQCREHNVTFTSLISLLIARILATTYPDYTRFRSVQAMSFRRFTGTSHRAMVNYVSSYSHDFSSIQRSGYIPCGGEFSWDSVKMCHEDIKAATASPRNQQTGLLRFLNDYEGFFRGKIGQRREYSFEVSNVGIFDGGLREYGVKRITFSQPSNVVGAAYVFSVATAKRGDTSIVLTWQEDVVEAHFAEKVITDLESSLRKLAQI
jgi:hypothetical protein